MFCRFQCFATAIKSRRLSAAQRTANCIQHPNDIGVAMADRFDRTGGQMLAKRLYQLMA